MQLQVVYPEALESSRLFRKSNLELIPRKRSFGCRVPMFVLVPIKADPITKKRSCKQGTIGASGAGGIVMISALLGGLRVWDDWLEPASLGTGVF